MELKHSPNWEKLYEALGLTEETAGSPSTIAKIEIAAGQVIITHVEQKNFTWTTNE